MFKVNQKVLYRLKSDTEHVDKIMTAVVTKVMADSTIEIRFDEDGMDRLMYSAFVYPDTPESRQHIERGIEMSAAHKKESDAYMTATYQLLNKQSRAGER